MARRITFSKVDELGRVVIPKQYRDALGIKNKDILYVEQVSNDAILLKCKNSIRETSQNILQEIQTIDSNIASLCDDPALANILKSTLAETARKIDVFLENIDES